LIVCTQKDLVKVQKDRLSEMPLWAVAIEMQFLSGQESLEANVAGTLRVP
jgi:tetraacyldisaccharide-1-P 4'-kinase